MKGTVKTYSPFTGYGFIIGEDGREYFVYWSFILMPGFRQLRSDQEVIFEPHESYRGLQARDVHLAEEIAEERILKPNPFTPHQPVTDPAKFAGRRGSLLRRSA